MDSLTVSLPPAACICCLQFVSPQWGDRGSRNTILAAPGLQRALPARVRGQSSFSSLLSKSCENESDALNSAGHGRQSQQIWQRGGQILHRFCCTVCLAPTQQQRPSCSPRMEEERMHP